VNDATIAEVLQAVTAFSLPLKAQQHPIAIYHIPSAKLLKTVCLRFLKTLLPLTLWLGEKCDYPFAQAPFG
jgi:hypothetical protein